MKKWITLGIMLAAATGQPDQPNQPDQVYSWRVAVTYQEALGGACDGEVRLGPYPSHALALAAAQGAYRDGLEVSREHGGEPDDFLVLQSRLCEIRLVQETY